MHEIQNRWGYNCTNKYGRKPIAMDMDARITTILTMARTITVTVERTTATAANVAKVANTTRTTVTATAANILV